MAALGELFGFVGKKVLNNPGKSLAVAFSAATVAHIATSPSQPTPDKPVSGPLASLDASSSPYQFHRLSYPLGNLGEGTRHPHFITFFINARKQSSYYTVPETQTRDRESAIQQHAHTTANYNNLLLPVVGEKVNFQRKTFRTMQSIRLYMPDTLHWTFRNQWKDVSLTEALPSIFTKGVELASDVIGSIKSGISDGSSLSSIAESVLKKGSVLGVEQMGKTLGIDRDVALSSYGYAINPNIDVIYGAPELRNFVFDFVFAPRSTAEANEVLSIIRAFKFHAAPEAASDSGAGRYFIPPSEFDIEFSVTSMGKISTCVLESVDVDYAPNGWSAYAEELHKNDMPTNIRMQLNFRELEYMTKARIMEGH